FSDGDIADKEDTARVLGTVVRNGKNMSVDVAVYSNTPAGSTEMEKVFQEVIDREGNRMVGIVRGDDPKRIPLDLAQLMLRRVRGCPVVVEPDSEKRARLKKLHRTISG